MNPLSLHVLVVTTEIPAAHNSVRVFVDTNQKLLRSLGDRLIESKPEEALRVSYEILPAEGVE